VSATPIRVQRVGLIGDVHTEHQRLTRAIEHLKQQRIDALLCTGDIPDGRSSPRDVDRCCTTLQQAGVLTITGNHDRWLQDDEMRALPDATPRDEVTPATLSYLASLPATIELQTPLGPALLCHGLGPDDMAQVYAHERGRELERNVALQALLTEGRIHHVLNGHTHRPGILRVDDLTIINAGTLQRDSQPCCVLVDFEQRQAIYYAVADYGPFPELTREAF
jgi:predicted phosphodiesterase